MIKFSSQPLQIFLVRCLQPNRINPTRQICELVNSTGFVHSNFHSNRLLDNLFKSGRIEEAWKMFDEMPVRDEFTWNTMIAAFSNAGRLDEAMEIFSNAPNRTSIAWSSLISGFSRHGCGVEALELFWQMQIEGQKPTQYTLGSVLRACATFAFIREGEQIHAHVVKLQFDSHVFVVTGLVDMYAKCKRILEAESLFNMISDKNNRVLWTAMVTGYSQSGDGYKAMKCFRDMRAEGVGSNQFTFPSILTACATVSAYRFGVQVHSCILHSGFGINVFVESALVDMYAKCGDLNSARRVLESMLVQDVISWNSLLGGCVRQGFQEEALSLFRKMHMHDMKVDDFTYPSVLNSFASLKDVKNSESVHGLIIKTGFEAYKHVGNALVDMYAKQGKSDSSFRIFHNMAVKDVVSWTSLVTGYAHVGSLEEALKMFCDMRISGINPDQFVIASILSACAEITMLGFGQQVHLVFVKSGLCSSLSVDNSLVTMYAKCGCIEDAHRVFDSMPVRDVITWTALIVGYAQNGRGKESLCLYDQMIASGTRPDFVTFIGLLFACSHAGLLEDGRFFFESMEKVYGIKPGPEHYACMIDLLGRSGKIDEAKELLNLMTCEPDAIVWKALLAACRVHGNSELAEMAANKLLELEPMNSVPYIMLCNIYSAVGRWDDASRVRKRMKSRKVSKEPGCSWIEMNSAIHTFMAEDRSHPRISEIYSKVHEIIILIEKAGYVPDVNFALHDTDEEGKKLGLTYHSEKLAIAFGLISAPSGVPIRIFKNLRVCGDCHTAFKFISRVFQRRIIMRDANCFHHFYEGTCSCGDYW